MENKKGNHGGVRPGAGRPALPKGERRTRLVVFVSQETLDRVTALRQQGFNVGRWIDGALDRLYRKQ